MKLKLLAQVAAVDSAPDVANQQFPQALLTRDEPLPCERLHELPPVRLQVALQTVCVFLGKIRPLDTSAKESPLPPARYARPTPSHAQRQRVVDLPFALCSQISAGAHREGAGDHAGQSGDEN